MFQSQGLKVTLSLEIIGQVLECLKPLAERTKFFAISIEAHKTEILLIFAKVFEDKHVSRVNLGYIESSNLTD